jgi:hypothetical protein
MSSGSYVVKAHFSLRENQDVWVLSLHIVLETLYDHLNLRNARPRLLCDLTFFWLEARPHIFQEAIRDVPSTRGGNEILAGRTLFVGCPFGARPVCSAEPDAAVTFAFFVCSDPTDFSPSGSESAFRLPELTARFGGMGGTTYEVKQDLNERQSGGRVDHARVA